jgi:ribosome-binding factor A
MAVNRTEKVAELLKEEISDVIRTRIKDPGVGFITITDVVVSKDLRIGKIYVSVLGSEEEQVRSLHALQRARSFIQREVGTRVRLRYLPVIQFYLDKSWEYGAHIDQLLHKLGLDEPALPGNES